MRKGIWDGKPAVYKTYECVETEDLEDARRDICTTLEVLADLKPLQVRHNVCKPKMESELFVTRQAVCLVTPARLSLILFLLFIMAIFL